LEQLAVQLLDRAKDEGASLVGPGGLLATGLTRGEICAHLREFYGAEISMESISPITDRVVEVCRSGRTGPWTR
jgi:hypothetical protein